MRVELEPSYIFFSLFPIQWVGIGVLVLFRAVYTLWRTFSTGLATLRRSRSSGNCLCGRAYIYIYIYTFSPFFPIEICYSRPVAHSKRPRIVMGCVLIERLSSPFFCLQLINIIWFSSRKRDKKKQFSSTHLLPPEKGCKKKNNAIWGFWKVSSLKCDWRFLPNTSLPWLQYFFFPIRSLRVRIPALV